MIDVNFTLVKKRAGPWIQFGVSLAIGWAGMLICKFGHVGKGAEYFAAMIALIFYTLINTVVSIAQKSFLRYTVPSYYIYILLLIILLLSSKFLSHISIWNLEEYRRMIVSISLFYLMASLLVRGVRFIYELAEKD